MRSRHDECGCLGLHASEGIPQGQFTNDQTNAVVLQHELSMLDVMTMNRDARVWAVAQGKEIAVDDSNVPKPVEVISNVGGGSKSSSAVKEGRLNYISGEEGLKHMAVADGFEVSLFADEARFPQLVNPVQLQFDTKGRLWAADWPTYPKWEPLEDVRRVGQQRNFLQGQLLFTKLACAQCHKMTGADPVSSAIQHHAHGGHAHGPSLTVGPDLTDVVKKHKGDPKVLLQEILEGRGVFQR